MVVWTSAGFKAGTHSGPMNDSALLRSMLLGESLTDMMIAAHDIAHDDSGDCCSACCLQDMTGETSQ